MITFVLEKVGWNRSRAAKILKISYKTLLYKMNEFKDNGIDFIVGIGGGSPLDASKMIGVLLENPGIDVRDLISTEGLSSKPIIAIPTTSGTSG